jgi:hypothetical protein
LRGGVARAAPPQLHPDVVDRFTCDRVRVYTAAFKLVEHTTDELIGRRIACQTFRSLSEKSEQQNTKFWNYYNEKLE